MIKLNVVLLVLAICLLSVASFAQSPYIKVTASPDAGTITFQNISRQTILAFVSQAVEMNQSRSATIVNGKVVGRYRHDFYFKRSGFPAGGSAVLETRPSPEFPAPKVTAEVLFIQFEDGSTWGDPGNSDVKELFAQRAATKALLTRLAAAPTEEAFLQVLKENREAQTSMSSAALPRVFKKPFQFVYGRHCRTIVRIRVFFARERPGNHMAGCSTRKGSR